MLAPTIADPPDTENACRLAGNFARSHPSDPDAQRIYVRSLFNLGHWSDTLAAADHGLVISSNKDPALEFIAGSVHLKLAAADDALNRFDRCLALSPDSADCLLWTGIAQKVFHSATGVPFVGSPARSAAGA